MLVRYSDSYQNIENLSEVPTSERTYGGSRPITVGVNCPVVKNIALCPSRGTAADLNSDPTPSADYTHSQQELRKEGAGGDQS